MIAVHDVRVVAGCLVCGGGGYGTRWRGPFAAAEAARHCNETGHRTWCERMESTHFSPAVEITTASAHTEDKR